MNRFNWNRISKIEVLLYLRFFLQVVLQVHYQTRQSPIEKYSISCQKFNFLSHRVSSDRNSGRRPRLAAPLAWEYISDKSRLSKCHFSKSIWCAFQWSKSLSRIIYRFSWAIQIRCRSTSKFGKLRFLRDFEICQSWSRNSFFCSFCFFVRLLVLPIFKHL